MGEISSASSEQSLGVSQVGEAMTQMDQATQQNAALVEESAAAAESLKAQAQQLVEAVAVFKLTGGKAPSIPAPVAKAPQAPVIERSMGGSPTASPTKVTRPAFKPAATPAPVAAAPMPKTGTDDWETF